MTLEPADNKSWPRDLTKEGGFNARKDEDPCYDLLFCTPLPLYTSTFCRWILIVLCSRFHEPRSKLQNTFNTTEPWLESCYVKASTTAPTCLRRSGQGECLGVIVDKKWTCSANMSLPQLHPFLSKKKAARTAATMSKLLPASVCGHAGVTHARRHQLNVPSLKQHSPPQQPLGGLRHNIRQLQTPAILNTWPTLNSLFARNVNKTIILSNNFRSLVLFQNRKAHSIELQHAFPPPPPLTRYFHGKFYSFPCTESEKCSDGHLLSPNLGSCFILSRAFPWLDSVPDKFLTLHFARDT